MRKTRRVVVVPPQPQPPPTPPLSSASRLSSPTGRGLPTLAAVPDAVLTHAISWLDWNSYRRTCRLSQRFRRLSRLPAATPALVSLEPPAPDEDENGAIRTAAVAWIKRASPATVALDLHRASGGGSGGGDLLADVNIARWSTAVTPRARTLRLVGPVKARRFTPWAALALSTTLVHLELCVTVASHERMYQRLPDEVCEIVSLRSLKCSGGRNALTVDSRQVAQLTQLTSLDITRVAHDHYARGERYHDGLILADARHVAACGQLRHLRLQHAAERDLVTLGSTELGARIETLRLPATDRYKWTAAFPATLPALLRVETTWLSDAHAEMLAARAPALVALELRPLTQRVTLDVVVDEEDGKEGERDSDADDDDDGEKEETEATGGATRVAIGVYEPAAGLGLMCSLARHLPHLRELVMLRHHADLRPLSALTLLAHLVCCDRPRLPNATRWPAALPALVELRVVDITRGDKSVVTARGAASLADEERRNKATRRRQLIVRFPRLEYLRFVRIEDEVRGGDDCDEDGVLNDDSFDPVRRDPGNGFVAPS